jgi:rhodanese-related sulfurtransferase
MMDGKRTGMRVVLVLAAIAAFALMLAWASGNALANGAPPTVYQTTLGETDRTAEVSTDELRAILAAKSAFVLDARPYEEFNTSHIPGALNVAAKPGVPPSQYVSDVAEIGRIVGENKAAPLVLYCNGPFCGKSKRLATELLDAGYTNVRRYQLGIPTWRALVGITEIEQPAIRYVAKDRTAVFVDARSPEVFARGSFPKAVNIPLDQVTAAKDDGRLPMHDHNTRIIVFGADREQASKVAEAIAKNAFHNVAFFGGGLGSMLR